MVFRLFRYRLLILIRNKETLLWSLLFPFVLGTFFFAAFSSITEKTEHLDKIDVAICDIKDDNFTKFMNTMDETGYISSNYVSYDEGLKLLKDNEVKAVIYLGMDSKEASEICLIVKSNGVDATVIKTILDTYKRNAKIIEDTIKKNPLMLTSVMEEMFKDEDFVKDIPLGAKNADPFVKYFFALLSMTCLFGSTLGLDNTKHIQADQSCVGMRRNVAPTYKMISVFTDFAAALVVEMATYITLFIYLTKILDINMGDSYGKIMLTGFLSSLLGISLGYFAGVFIKANTKVKETIISSLVLFMNFLAGLMVQNMKEIIEASAPIVNRINPAALIVDCFESICVLEDSAKYMRCTISMTVWIVVLFVLSVTVLRREKYANL